MNYELYYINVSIYSSSVGIIMYRNGDINEPENTKMVYEKVYQSSNGNLWRNGGFNVVLERRFWQGLSLFLEYFTMYIMKGDDIYDQTLFNSIVEKVATHS